MAEVVYNDETVMPFGIHKGTKLANVPNSYLLGLHENGRPYGAMKDYIDENLDAIKLGAKKEKADARRNNRFNTR